MTKVKDAKVAPSKKANKKVKLSSKTRNGSKNVTSSSGKTLDNASAARLRDILATVETAQTITSPLLQSIESLLRLSAQVMGSEEASVLTRDGTRGGLKFLVALGDYAHHLKKMKIPPGKGIAGFVFTSGQPVAVADVSQDESFYAAVDQETGHQTSTLIATPLRLGEETIGVLEYVNRSPEKQSIPFSPGEMDQAAGFADTIAYLVDAYEKAALIESLLSYGLDQSAQRPGKEINWHQWLNHLRAAPEHKQLLSLAVSLRDIASQGEDERKLCHDVLTALSHWTSKRKTSPPNYFA